MLPWLYRITISPSNLTKRAYTGEDAIKFACKFLPNAKDKAFPLGFKSPDHFYDLLVRLEEQKQPKDLMDNIVKAYEGGNCDLLLIPLPLPKWKETMRGGKWAKSVEDFFDEMVKESVIQEPYAFCTKEGEVPVIIMTNKDYTHLQNYFSTVTKLKQGISPRR